MYKRMHPVLIKFQIGDGTVVGIPSFGLFVFFGVIIGSVLVFMRVRRTGMTFLEFSALWGYIVGFGFLGAIFAGILFSPHDFFASFDFSDGYFSLALQGGLIAGTLAAARMLKELNRPVVMTLDLIIPPIFIGLAVGRIGCLLGGCCYGSLTRLPWGVCYPPGHPSHDSYGLQSLHPTPLYSAILALLIALFAWVLTERRTQGWVLTWSVVLYFSGRLGLELLRGDHGAVAGGLTPQQWCSLAVIAGFLAWFTWYNKRGRPREGTQKSRTTGGTL